LVEGQIAVVLSDNGSEWNKYFEEGLKKLNILHIFTRVKTPKDNASNERFRSVNDVPFEYSNLIFK